MKFCNHRMFEPDVTAMRVQHFKQENLEKVTQIHLETVMQAWGLALWPFVNQRNILKN